MKITSVEVTVLGNWAVAPKDGYISAPDVPGVGIDLSAKALYEAKIVTINS